MPPKTRKPKLPATLNNAKWLGSKAKDQIAQDIIDGLIPSEGKINVKEIFGTMYKDNPLFKDFPWNEERYVDRIQSLRTGIATHYKWAEQDRKAVIEDLKNHPPPPANIRGELRWEGSDAQRLLKQDVDEDRHKDLSPSGLRETRPEYKLFTRKVFTKHIDQEKQDRKEFNDNGKRYKKNHFGDKALSRIDN